MGSSYQRYRGVGQRIAEVDRVRQVESGRPVVHERVVIANVFANCGAQFCVSPSVTPRMKLERRISQFNALCGDVKILGNAREGCRRRVRRESLAENLPEPPTWAPRSSGQLGPTTLCRQARGAKWGVHLSDRSPTSDARATHAEAGRRQSDSSRKTCSKISATIGPLPRRGAIATPSTPSSVLKRMTPTLTIRGLPRKPSRQINEGFAPGAKTLNVSTLVIRISLTTVRILETVGGSPDSMIREKRG